MIDYPGFIDPAPLIAIAMAGLLFVALTPSRQWTYHGRGRVQTSCIRRHLLRKAAKWLPYPIHSPKTVLAQP